MRDERGPGRYGPPRVLLVDDNAAFRRELRALLEVERIRVVGEAADGRQALELTDRLKPDVVLMDQNMPVMSGVDATRRIKRRHPNTRVIFVAAENSWRAEALRAGAEAYFAKGEDLELVVDAIEDPLQPLRLQAQPVDPQIEGDRSRLPWQFWLVLPALALLLAMAALPDVLLPGIALLFGLFFFVYSLRYYAADALILLSTSGTNGNGNGHPPSDGKKGGRGSARGMSTLGAGNGGNGRLHRQPFISIHLPLYNEKEVVDRLLTACTSLDYDNYEIVVADDSTDETREILRQRWGTHPRVKISHRADRRGFKGGALKVALERTNPHAEFVVVFDADFLPPPNILHQFLAYFYGTNGGSNGNGHTSRPNAGESGVGDEELRLIDDQVAVVQGYQWHVLNASENWITKGIRSEFAGSYVVERAGQEMLGALKMISGSVFMIRAEVLREHGWGTSITEDWELTLRLYLNGYKVLYTPFIQAPAECVAEFKQLARQRMRWAEGHTYNVKKYFLPVLRSANLTLREKFEFLYYSLYYLQSGFFILGTTGWFVSEIILRQRLPFWTDTLGWALVLANLFSLLLMNLTGLFLERGVRRNWTGLMSFVLLSTLLVPYQAYAALKGLLEPHEGGWHRTKKSGVITEVVSRLGLGKRFNRLLPKKKAQAHGRAARRLATIVPAPIRSLGRGSSPGLRLASGVLTGTALLAILSQGIARASGAPQGSILVLTLVIVLPMLTAVITRRMRLAVQLITGLVTCVIVLGLFARQLPVARAAPDSFYLHDTDVGGVSPPGKGMDSSEGATATTLTLDAAGQNAYWYTGLTYPTGADDAGVAAGDYTANLYFAQLPTLPSDWYGAGWHYRKKITVDHTHVAGDQTDFPILVSLSSDPYLASKAQEAPTAGNDILFTLSDGTTKISHEIEKFDDATGELVAWVELPTISSSADTEIYMYYGNPSAGDQQDPGGTWSNGYLEVWHLDETSGDHTDSTSNGYTGTASGSVDQDVTGQIEGADEFLGPSTNTYLTLADGDLGNNAPFSLSAWFRFDTPTAWAGILTKGRETGNDWIGLWANDTQYVFGWDWQGGKGGNVDGVTTLSIDTWYYGTATFDGTDRRLYLDGALDGGPSPGNYAGLSGTDTSVGNDVLDTNANSFDGIIDEVRLSSQARSPTWIQTEYANQSSPSTFFQALGPEEVIPSVAVTATVTHTDSGGGAAITIVAASTTIYPDTPNPLALDLGSGAQTTFSTADPRKLQFGITVDSVAGGGSFDLVYDGSCASNECSNLDTPVVTVPEWGIVFLPLVPLIPFLVSLFWRRRRLAWRLAAILLAISATLVTLAGQVEPVTAAPDTHYLHPTATSGINPAGEYMNISLGSGGSTKAFNTPGQNAYWYLDQTWPTGGDDATIAAGAYTFNMYFNQLPVWYDPSWTCRKRITIDHTRVPGDLTDFPVLINLGSDADLVAGAQTDGDDILFTSSDGTTKLSHEIELYTSSNGALVAWVKAPNLSSSVDTVLYMYYCNASASNQQNVANTWSNGFAAVQHLAQATGTQTDSTGRGNSGTLYGTTSFVTGQKIDGSRDFNGSSGHIRIANSTDINLGGPFTNREISLWFSADTTSGRHVIYEEGGNLRGFNIYIDSGYLYVGGWNTPVGESNWAGTWHSTPISANTWYYVTLLLTGGTSTVQPNVFRAYLNGAQFGSGNGSQLWAHSGAINTARSDGASLYHSGSSNQNYYFDGKVDEWRLSNVTRSANWIATCYNNQNSPGTFYSLGSQESQPSVNITVSVHNTRADGSDAQLIVSNSTTITPWTSNPLAFGLGSGLLQTYTVADPRRLRLQVTVTSVTNGGSFSLWYDGTCAIGRCTNLDTPVVTVPENGLLFAFPVLLIPAIVGEASRRRRRRRRSTPPGMKGQCACKAP